MITKAFHLIIHRLPFYRLIYFHLPFPNHRQLLDRLEDPGLYLLSLVGVENH